ncbi:unnamed protein product [Cylicocyclus nassatus]|uniref:Uncharacterized protein n=1 Tax=Cylicocyclus nassatus TaxID=53992 RepID=A0AA36M0C5_CYLNA|nr:unnamed protein product [Cylicocyclus nassatus]
MPHPKFDVSANEEEVKRHPFSIFDTNAHKSAHFFFYDQTRLVILALSTLCLTLLHSNTLTLNFTVICMDDVVAKQSSNSSEPHWLQSPSRINTLFSAIAAGALIGTFPIMALVARIGMRNVSKKELSKIQRNKNNIGLDHHDPVPYSYIIRDPCILGIWSSITGANLGFFAIFYYGPVYVNKATGFATALPFILSAIVKLFAGPVSDKSTCVSERTRILIFTCVSQGFLAFFFLVMALTTSATVAQTAYTAAIVSSGFNVVGSVKCSQLRARQHTHFVMAVVSCNACVITLLLPFVVTLVCPDNTREQWSQLFCGISAIVVVANLPFLVLAQTGPAPWTMPAFLSSRKTAPTRKQAVTYLSTSADMEFAPESLRVY